MLAVEICSAAYYSDDTLETAVANAICADGAAAFLLGTGSVGGEAGRPEILDFESLLDSTKLDKVGFTQQEGKLRIVLAPSMPTLAASLVKKAIHPLMERNGLAGSDIRFWVMHPGGRKVMDRVQEQLGLTDGEMQFSRSVLRNYGNMSSVTAMFVLDEVVRHGDPRPGDLGLMIGIGPGMAAELALLRW